MQNSALFMESIPQMLSSFHKDNGYSVINHQSICYFSYIKLLNSTADMLLPVITYNLYGKVAGTYVYYDASYEYFGKAHLPYDIFLFSICPATVKSQMH